jgi:AraC-like DNA-binding protein
MQIPNLATLASALVFAYGFVFLHLSVFVMALRKKTRVNNIFAALLLDYGLMCFISGAGAVQDHPAGMYYALTFTLLLFLSPLTAAYVMEFLGDDKKKKRLAAISVSTALGLALGIALGVSGVYWRRLLSLAYALLFLNFTALGIVEMREIGSIRSLTPSLKVLFLSYWGIALELLALCIVQFLLVGAAMRALWLAASLTLITHTLLVNRDPDVYRKYEQMTNEARLSRSRLAGVDLKSKFALLDQLMTHEKIYCDSRLQLEELAQRIDLSGPQLSELINRHLGNSYSGYINGLRVTEARRLLLERRDLSILDICYECGFSSKSSFNAVFKQETAMTPSDYRKKHRNDEK